MELLGFRRASGELQAPPTFWGRQRAFIIGQVHGDTILGASGRQKTTFDTWGAYQNVYCNHGVNLHCPSTGHHQNGYYTD